MAIKYIEKEWTQPVLTSNGTLGGTSPACVASNESGTTSTIQYAYYAFDNESSTYWRCSTATGWIEFYNPIAIKVGKIHIVSLTNSSNIEYGTISSGTVYGSNDGTNWTTLKTFTNSTIGAYTINVNSTAFYKYHKIESTGVQHDVIHIRKIVITAKYLLGITVEDTLTNEDMIKADDFNNVTNNVITINTSTGSKSTTSLTDVTKGDAINKTSITAIRNAINSLETVFSSNCCQNVNNDCCQGCQGCQSCQTCQSQTCQSTTCQSKSCQSGSCQSCQSCQTCQSCQE